MIMVSIPIIFGKKGLKLINYRIYSNYRTNTVQITEPVGKSTPTHAIPVDTLFMSI